MKGGSSPAVPGALGARACILLILLAAGSATRAQGPAPAAMPGSIGDGRWEVRGRAISGTRCGDWFVRLTTLRGRLYGVVGVGAGTVPLHNLALLPDGSFAGSTVAGWTGSRMIRAYKVAGRFSGDAVSLTMESELCPPRSGTASRTTPG
jgi:hypothetical protein